MMDFYEEGFDRGVLGDDAGGASLKGMIEAAVRGAQAGREVELPMDQGRDIHITLELDRQQFARAVYRLGGEEARRVGADLSGGDM